MMTSCSIAGDFAGPLLPNRPVTPENKTPPVGHDGAGGRNEYTL